jgi:hypothetical protein
MVAASSEKDLLLSLTPIKIVALAMIAGPWLALYWSYALGEQYLGLGADRNLLYSYSIYAGILVFLILRTRSNLTINLDSVDIAALRRYQPRVFGVSLCCFVFVYAVAGIRILSGEMNRGDVRISLGFLGPVYTFVANFALPALVFCNFLISVCLRRKRLTLTLLTYVFVFLAAFVTGYKSSVTMIFLLPLATCLWPTTSLLKKGVIGLVALATIIGSQVLLGNDEVTVLDSFRYNVSRATSVAAYGLLGSWEMSKDNDLKLTPVIVDSVFGSHLSSVFLEMIGGTQGQLPGNFAKLVTYEFYPDRESADSGSINVTLTLFGELVLLLHRFWILGLAFFICVVNLALTSLRRQLSGGNLRTGVLVLVFFIFVILPIITSSGILTIISLPTIAYLTWTHLLLTYLLPKIHCSMRL